MLTTVYLFVRMIKIFISDGQLFQFTCLPNGHVISAYVDNTFNLGMTYQECQQNIANTINLLESLAFFVHPDISKFIPSLSSNMLEIYYQF